MRLIDADELKREDLCDFCNSADCANCFSDKAFEEWIASQPTAYDIDKVVEQLEELVSYKMERSRMYDGHTHYDSEIMGITQAIEIVKKGGAV